MLRCTPSRISFTPSDIADFEHRYAARHSTRFGKGKTTKVRLSPGPAHSTHLSLVSAEQNIGRQRAASSSSEATIHNNDEEPAEQSDSPPSVDTINTEEGANDIPSQLSQANSAIDRPVSQRPSLLAAAPRRQVDSFYGTEHVLDFRTPKHETTSSAPPIGSNVGLRPDIPSTQAHCIPWTPRGHQVLDEIRRDAYPVSRQPRTESPLLASARARRRQARSEDSGVFEEPYNIQEFTMRLYNDVPVSRRNATTAFAVPELVLPVEDSFTTGHASLDPGAPIFTPRTRFGTVTGSSGDASRLQTNLAGDFANLRVRSSSEQNADVPGRHQDRPQHQDDVQPVSSFNEQPVAGRSRRRSRTADQNIALPHMTPALDRYPLLRPVFRPNVEQRGRNLHQSTQSLAYGSQPRDSLISSQEEPRAPLHRESHLRIRNASGTRNDLRAESSNTRSISPALSVNSLSTPNLLQYPTRGSSLPWNRVDSRTPSLGRVPSMVSVASGISGGREVSRQSSRETLDAAAAFLRMRNSPLDDLTEQLSRLSTNRPRSVGRSWDRPPRPRVSLLSGDPFRPEPPPYAAPSTPVTSMQVATPAALPPSNANHDATPEEIVALALALPPSSPLRSSSIGLPSTPSLHFSDPKSPRSPLHDNGAAKSPECTIRRKPVPALATTPKVPVYDDTKPPDTQPQTPADVRGSKRRAKTRSATSVQQPPIFVRQAMISSPPFIPERHPHRYTYPPTGPVQSNTSTDISASASSTTATTVNLQQTGRQNRLSSRARVQRGSEQAENDLAGHLEGLEDDHRTWLSRHEGGDLDVTPPREGRFEQYLS